MKYFNFLIPVLVFLFISACPTGPMSGPSEKGQTITNVVEFSVLPERPPRNIYENTPFDIGLIVKNYDLEDKNIMICVNDEYTDYFGGIPYGSCKNVLLEKAQQFKERIIPSEKEVFMPGEGGKYAYKNIRKDEDTKFTITLRYPYTSVAFGSLCLATDYGQGCNIEENVQLETKGPVKITSLKKTIIPYGGNSIQLRLEMDIQNSGTGKVIEEKDVFSDQESEPLIGIHIKLPGIRSDFQCSPLYNGKIKLFKDSITLTCVSDLELPQKMLTNPIEIKLTYGYQIEKVINVKILKSSI